MSFWKQIGSVLSGAGGGLIDSLGKNIDRFVTTKEEKEQLRQAMVKLVQDHESRLQEQLLNEFKAEIADRDSARNREIEMAKADKPDWLMYVTGLVALFCFVAMVLAVILSQKLELGIAELPVFHQLIGLVEGVALTVFAYYFGTSKSSADKTRHISNLKRNEQGNAVQDK